MKANKKTIECVSYKNFKKLRIDNLPNSISKTVTVIVDTEGTLLYASGYKEILGINERKVILRKMSNIEPCAKTIKMLHMNNPSITTGDNVLPSLGNLRVEGMIMPLFTKDHKLLGGLTSFVPIKDVEIIRDIINNIDFPNISVSFDNMLNNNEIPLKNNRKIMMNSECYRQVIKLALNAARSEFDVLVTGETGVGKELVAELIHLASPRRNGPFIIVNCAAIPETLLESELFGYEAGSFTGASKSGKHGKLEAADGGTLFLDEIGEMSLPMQAKLLRALQEREIQKIGGIGTKKVDIRVIAATNRNLSGMVESGEFRNDLFYRLNVITVSIPPLRRRKEDIITLSQHFLENIKHKTGIEIALSEKLINYFYKYNWPGNVRELENLLKYSSVLALDKDQDFFEVDFDDLACRIMLKNQIGDDNNYDYVPIKVGTTLRTLCEETEKKAILATLAYCNFNKTKASQMLGITRQALYQKAKQFRINI